MRVLTLFREGMPRLHVQHGDHEYMVSVAPENLINLPGTWRTATWLEKQPVWLVVLTALGTILGLGCLGVFILNRLLA